MYGASSSGSGASTDDYLVVTRGSKIVVNGTADSPVRMTARAAINDEETNSTLLDDGTTAQWGGLVINGFAPINDCDVGTIAGGSADCEKLGEGASGLFGGDQADDSSGSIKYLTVEYAGARLTNEDELNGIAFQGVGSGTEVDYVQIHNNLDDGVEWFGGTVNVSHLVVTGAGDDSIDWTDGWQGALQYAVVKSTVPSSDDPRGIEADNQRPTDLTPFSDPTISNFTLIGTTGNQQGILLRRGTKGRIVNGIVTGFESGIDLDDAQTFANLDAGDLVVQSLFLDNPVNFTQDDDPLAVPPAASNVRTGSNTLSNEFFPGTAELNVPAYTLPNDGFLEQVNYIGAFSSTETVDNNWANFATPGTLFPADDSAPATCPTGTTTSGELDNKTLCQIIAANGAVTGDLRLSDGDELIYELVGPVFVGIDRGPDPANPLSNGAAGSITIDAGVTVVSANNDDYLVVSRGSQIRSNGTATNPVVFTAKGVFDGSAISANTKGIWGGLVLNGRGPINDCDVGSETGGTIGCEKQGEGASGLFGGASPADDSGQLFYTRVEYAGVRLTNEDELNGIAFQGVGSGTEVDYVQVYNNLDDCFEWFGGTVNASHLVANGCGDDSIDWTDGWTGSVQYAIVYPGENDLSDDPRGIEADNQRPNDLTPRSAPDIANFTIVNSGDDAVDAGAVLRRGTAGNIVNGVIVGFDSGIDVDDTSTLDLLEAGTLNVASIFLDNTTNLRDDDDTSTSGKSITDLLTVAKNIIQGTNTLSGTSFRDGRPGVRPGTAEAGVTAFDTTTIGLEAAPYVGAVADENDNWFLGWTVDETRTLTSN